MKNYNTKYACFFFYLMIMVLSARTVFCDPIPMELARQVAQNHIIHINSSHTIKTIEPQENDGRNIAYLVHLSPGGYVLVAGDNIRIPVKAYSINSNFSDLPEAYRNNLLNELEISSISNAGLGMSAAKTTNDINAPYWDFLIKQVPDKKTSGFSTEAYVPDTFLLTTQWNQGLPYNKLNPKINGELTLTGCTQTAITQVMRYYSHPVSGSGVFTHDWNSSTLTAVMNRPFNWSLMGDSANQMLAEYQQDEVASLMRDLGILNKASFGVNSTSTYFQYNDFERAFGYAPIVTKSSSAADFFSTITNEIDNSRPVLLSMPGHLTVADGYASDGTGRKIHVNLGWGGAYDDYYYLDQTNIIGPYSFEPNHLIYYNLRPCEGVECNPYLPAGGENPPIIASQLSDIVIDSATILRIEAFDLDGDTVTLSASSACSGLQTEMTSNLLTLTPQTTNTFCQVRLNAQSPDGTTIKTFNVLSLENKIYSGTDYSITGQFADQSEVDSYQAYLGGSITISGDRGYNNQAFYIWIKNQIGTTVLGPSDGSISGILAPGIYTIYTSLTSGSSYYGFNTNYSAYSLNVTANDVNYTVSNLADDLNIDLILPQKAMPWIQLLLLND